jgi:N-acyl-D-aspartate/D-glutamate deacylase
MCEGGWGLSISLFNAPQGYATTEEIIPIAREAAKYGGIYHVHERDESSYSIGLMGSTLESIRVGREARIPVQITHIKGIGPDVWGQAPAVIAAIDKARAEGVDVTADQYPWAAASAGLEGMLIPTWAEAGGRAAFLKRLEDPALLARIRTEASENMRKRGGPDSLLLISIGHEWTGKTLTQMGQAWGVAPIDAALRVITSDVNAGSVASFSLSEPDVVAFMKAPWITVSSDGGQNHPRLYASYPRKFQKYAVEDKTITVQEFIRSATGREADFLKLDRRGYLKSGYFADVVVFDPQRFKQKADYLNWNIPSEGVDALFINGTLAVKDSQPTGALAGRTLLHTPTAGTCPKA